MFKNNNRIDKSKKIIIREKKKIKEEKKKIKYDKEKKFYNTKFGIFIKKLFGVYDNVEDVSSNIKNKLFYSFMYTLFGIFLCLIILYILSGGKNYFKLYYELGDFIDTYDAISNDHYDDIDKKDLINNAISSMVNSVGDGYTTYADGEEALEFQENITGTYNGIGCMVSMDQDSNIYVVEVFENGSASDAGIQVNDVILEVDDVDYTDKTSEDMALYVKNSSKKTVKFKIKRGEEELNVDVKLKKQEIPSVSSEIIEIDDKKIGYLDVDIFSGVTNKQFKNKLNELEKDNINSLIIDLRDNSGGYLDVVTDITSMFLEKGDIIYQLENKSGKIKKVKDDTKEERSYSIVVLVNNGSASASEILAAAIKDSYGGYVVGTTTFGKGSVQETKELSNGGMMKYTVQKWLTPLGKCIDKNGIAPNYVVEFEEKGFENDSQLDYAINLLK